MLDLEIKKAFIKIISQIVKNNDQNPHVNI